MPGASPSQCDTLTHQLDDHNNCTINNKERNTLNMPNRTEITTDKKTGPELETDTQEAEQRQQH